MIFNLSQGDILIVDDLLDNIQLLSSVLTQQGYQVRSVTNSQMALEIIHTSPPDLILLDIKMPLMDGYEVCQILKADAKTREIPVIFVSAVDEAFDKVRVLRIGGADYITKPFQLEEVLVRVEHQLTIQRQKSLLQQEIAQRQQAEEILFQSRTLLASVLNSSLDGIAAFKSIRDAQGQIIDFEWLMANRIAAQTVGKTTEELIGQRLIENLPGVQKEGLFAGYISVVETGEVFKKELYYDRDSIQGWFQVVAVKLGDGFALTFRDITERKQLELELHHLATLDGLTGMANRRRFDEYFTQEWYRCAREQQPLSLIFCDVDYFKSYNDAYGHLIGDDCLAKIAQAIRDAVKRPADLVARYGGEEFAVVLPNTRLEGAIPVAEAIRLAVQNLGIPYPQTNMGESVTLSSGVSTLIPSAHDIPSILINAADRALYQAKQQGRNCVAVYAWENN